MAARTRYNSQCACVAECCEYFPSFFSALGYLPQAEATAPSASDLVAERLLAEVLPVEERD